MTEQWQSNSSLEPFGSGENWTFGSVEKNTTCTYLYNNKEHWQFEKDPHESNKEFPGMYTLAKSLEAI